MRDSESALPDDLADQDTEPIPAELVAAWQRGESRLFSSVLWDPDSYRRSVELVGIVLEHLRATGPGTRALIAAAASGQALVEQALDGRTGGTAGLDVPGIAGAALAMRQREVVGEQARSRRLGGIAAAEGRTWVTLEEVGDPSGNPLLPYRRLEVEVATGRGLLVSSTADDTFTGCVHRVEQVRVDLTDGALTEADADAETYPTADAREQGACGLRNASPHP